VTTFYIIKIDLCLFEEYVHITYIKLDLFYSQLNQIIYLQENKFLNMYSNLAQQECVFTSDACNEVVSTTIGTNEYTYSYYPIGNRTASTQNAESK
jgi:hypothetical protein